MRVRWNRLPAVLTVLPVLAGCQGGDHPPEVVALTPMSVTGSTPPGTGMVVPATREPRALRVPRGKIWVDLDIGDCLADPPPSDPAEVTVTVVDCAAAHAAEVYLRTRVAVNDAIAGVADRQCEAGLAPYTGAPVDGGGYAITYLIDSMQDRTGAIPEPSTVICLLQAADGQPVTGTARH